MGIVDRIKEIGAFALYMACKSVCDCVGEVQSNALCPWLAMNRAEDEMKRTQKNKATEGHLGFLKAKLAKLRTEVGRVLVGPHCCVCSRN